MGICVHVRNSPLNFTDPTGHRECQILCAGDTISEQEIKFGSAYGGEWDPEQQAANRKTAQVVLVDAPKAAVGFFSEPVDWYFALGDGLQAYDAIGMIPFVPASVGRYADEVVPLAQRAIGGTGKAYNRLNGQGLYALLNKAGVVQYIGRGDAPERLLSHSRSPEFRSFRQRELASNNLSYSEARGLEQLLIDHLGLENLANKINGISLRNPNRDTYIAAGKALWDEVLSKLGVQK